MIYVFYQYVIIILQKIIYFNIKYRIRKNIFLIKKLNSEK